MVREAFFILIIAVKVASNRFNVLLLAMTRRNFVVGGG